MVIQRTLKISLYMGLAISRLLSSGFFLQFIFSQRQAALPKWLVFSLYRPLSQFILQVAIFFCLYIVCLFPIAVKRLLVQKKTIYFCLFVAKVNFNSSTLTPPIMSLPYCLTTFLICSWQPKALAVCGWQFSNISVIVNDPMN